MSNTETDWKPSHSPWLVAVSVLIATFMGVLDTSIANVSLPHIAGNLSVSNSEATWVLTSYLVSSSIILAASSWLSSYIGRKRFLSLSVLLFIISSALCGMAQNLTQLIIARVLQGMGGGGLQPASQAILLESFPKEKRGQAMAMFGMGIIVAPIIGPILGGWITENFSWRWIFYINVPIGFVGLFMQELFVEDPPYLEKSKGKDIDYIGLIVMAVSLGIFQIIMDKGQEEDWFNSLWISWGTFLVTFMFAFLALWELKEKNPFLNIRILKDRNFLFGTMIITIQGIILYATTAILPIFMQTLLGYDAFKSGLSMVPRGIGSMFSMIIVGKLVGRISNKILLIFGFLMILVSTYLLSMLNLDISQSTLILPLFVNGFGMGFVFVPLTVITMSTLKHNEINQATGLFSLLRNIGGSVGISIIFTLQYRYMQLHQTTLVSNINQFNPAYSQWLYKASHSPLFFLKNKLAAFAYLSVSKQAVLMSFLDCFRLVAILAFIAILLVFMFGAGKIRKKVKESAAALID